MSLNSQLVAGIVFGFGLRIYLPYQPCDIDSYSSTLRSSIISKFLTSPADTLNGESKIYYKSGKLKESAFFVNGLRDGVTTVYNPNGSLAYKATYKAGKLNGTFTHYERGIIYKKIDYKDSLFDGEWIFYISGRKAIEARFKMGKINGWFYDYYKTGKVHCKAYYKNGAIVSTELFFRRNGTLQYDFVKTGEANHLLLQQYYSKSGGSVVKRIFVKKRPVAYSLFGPQAFVAE